MPVLNLRRISAEAERETLLEVIENLANAESERYGQQQKVLFLDESGGFTLDQPVTNDKTANDSDTCVAFVYDRRYVSAEKLRGSPDCTSELES